MSILQVKKHYLQRSQVKAGNMYENLLNEIKQIVILCTEKKKLYNNITNSIKL